MSWLGIACVAAAMLAGPQTSARTAVVATVDGRAISSAIFEMYVSNAVDALALDSPPGGQRRASLESGILAELIDRALIETESRRRGLVPAPEKLEAHHVLWRNRLGGAQGYRAYLEEHGLTDAELRASLAQELYGELFARELTRELRITDAAVADFYRRHADESEWLRVPASVHASHILIEARRAAILRRLGSEGLEGAALEVACDAEVDRLEDLAQRLRARALAGGNFAALARRYSDDPGSRAAGGDLGWFRRGTHTPSFDESVFALAPGETGPVVRTDYGFHVVRVIDRKPEARMSLADAAPAIRRRLLAAKQVEMLNAWLRGARASADIVVLTDVDHRAAATAERSPE